MSLVFKNEKKMSNWSQAPMVKQRETTNDENEQKKLNKREKHTQSHKWINVTPFIYILFYGWYFTMYL